MDNLSSPVDLTLRVSVLRQVLEVLRGEVLVKCYSVSTSCFGLGSESGGLKTPVGKFVISEKFGHDALLRAILESRKLTGEIAMTGGDENLVLTRILWLDGLDVGNANTKERKIYIHETNQEVLIGQAARHGCVRMGNADVLDLFELVPEGTLVEILP